MNKEGLLTAENQLVFNYEQEQYALVYYVEHANPGPVLKQIAEERIKALEIKKNKYVALNQYPVTAPMPRLNFEECETVGIHKKELA